jgi:hypothetical protein
MERLPRFHITFQASIDSGLFSIFARRYVSGLTEGHRRQAHNAPSFFAS